MKAVCPNCLTVYNVKEESVPDGGTKAPCPNCRALISLQRPALVEKEKSEPDYAKTMVLFSPMPAQQEEISRKVLEGVAGETERLPDSGRVCIKVLDGDEAGKDYVLTKPRTTIGRSKADILVNDPEVSRQHAAIEVYGEKVVIKDLQSTNGTYVNQLGVRVSYLANGDEVQVGNTRFRVVLR